MSIVGQLTGKKPVQEEVKRSAGSVYDTASADVVSTISSPDQLAVELSFSMKGGNQGPQLVTIDLDTATKLAYDIQVAAGKVNQDNLKRYAAGPRLDPKETQVRNPARNGEPRS